MGLVRTVSEGTVTFGLEPAQPVPNDRRTGVEESSRRFDADLESFLNHLVTPMFFIFTVFHNMVIFVRTHNCFQASFQIPEDFVGAYYVSFFMELKSSFAIFVLRLLGRLA